MGKSLGCTIATGQGLCGKPSVTAEPPPPHEAATVDQAVYDYMPHWSYFGGGVCGEHLSMLQQAVDEAANDGGRLANRVDTIDFPPVTPGVKIYIQMMGPSSVGPDGTVDYTRAEVIEKIVHDSDECYPQAKYNDDPQLIEDYGPGDDHSVTICPDCVDSWAHDWYITLGDTPFSLGLREKI